MFSSCAIHNKFPFICFASGCVKQQFSIKPLKKRIQIALGGKKKKLKSSFTSSKNSNKNTFFPKNYKIRNSILSDSITKDSIINQNSYNSLALLDTVVRIYYKDLTDSSLNKYKSIIKSFVGRVGKNKISDISLVDFYSEDGVSNTSIKGDIEKYLLAIGISKHRLFWLKNRRIKLQGNGERPKKLIYLEIRIH